MSGDFDPAAIAALAATTSLVRRCVHLSETDSTQAVIRAAARQGEPGGLVVVADHQTAGRGQHGRTWYDAPGQTLLCSLLLRPTWLPPPHTPHLVNAFVATLADTLAAFVAVPVTIKWPNDVVLQVGGTAAKVAGALCEGQIRAGTLASVCIGWGVNISATPAAADIGQPASCLAAHAVTPPTRNAVVAAQLTAFAACLDRLRDDIHSYQPAWHARQSVLGQQVVVRSADRSVSGRALSLAADGGLQIETDAGIETVYGGWLSTDA